MALARSQVPTVAASCRDSLLAWGPSFACCRRLGCSCRRRSWHEWYLGGVFEKRRHLDSTASAFCLIMIPPTIWISLSLVTAASAKCLAAFFWSTGFRLAFGLCFEESIGLICLFKQPTCYSPSYFLPIQSYDFARCLISFDSSL